MTDWKPFPPVPPQLGQRILISGIWRSGPGAGEEIVVIATYSTTKSNGTGLHWMVADCFTALQSYEVDWKCWTEVPSAHG